MVKILLFDLDHSYSSRFWRSDCNREQLDSNGNSGPLWSYHSKNGMYVSFVVRWETESSTRRPRIVHYTNRSRPRSITWPHTYTRIAIDIGLDVIASTLPNNWPIFARPRRNTCAPLIFKVGDLAICIHPLSGRRAYCTSGWHCEFGDNCYMDHTSPHVLKRSFVQQGKCEYTRRKPILIAARVFFNMGDATQNGNRHRHSESSWEVRSAQSKLGRILRDNAVGI